MIRDREACRQTVTLPSDTDLAIFLHLLELEEELPFTEPVSSPRIGGYCTVREFWWRPLFGIGRCLFTTRLCWLLLVFCLAARHTAVSAWSSSIHLISVGSKLGGVFQSIPQLDTPRACNFNGPGVRNSGQAQNRARVFDGAA